MDWSSASEAERTIDCGCGVQCPKERKPMFFTSATTLRAARAFQRGPATVVLGQRPDRAAAGRESRLVQARHGSAELLNRARERGVRRGAEPGDLSAAPTHVLRDVGPYHHEDLDRDSG